MSNRHFNALVSIKRHSVVDMAVQVTNTLRNPGSRELCSSSSHYRSGVLKFNLQVLIINNRLVNFLSVDGSARNRVVHGPGSLLKLSRLS